jgi:dsDNA-binding SOS-regulon protein
MNAAATLAGAVPAAKPNQPYIVLQVPYGTLHIDRRGADDHLGMRADQLSELLAYMSGSNDEHDPMLSLAEDLASQVRDCIGMSNSDRASQVALRWAEQAVRLLHLIQPDEGPGPSLWLAQQLANELNDLMHMMVADVAQQGGIA